MTQSEESIILMTPYRQYRFLHKNHGTCRQEEPVGQAVEHLLVDHAVDFISQIDCNDERNHADAQKFKKFRIVQPLFIVCEHEDKVQHGPDGSHIGTEGIFIPEGRCQVNDQERAAGSKHAVDDARAEKDRNGNPDRKGCTGRFQEKIFKRHADNEKSVHRHKNTGVHNIVEINTGRHADKHEESDASQFFFIDVLSVFNHKVCADQPADHIDDRFGHVRPVKQDCRRNREHDTGKSGECLYDIRYEDGCHEETQFYKYRKPHKFQNNHAFYIQVNSYLSISFIIVSLFPFVQLFSKRISMNAFKSFLSM